MASTFISWDWNPFFCLYLAIILFRAISASRLLFSHPVARSLMSSRCSPMHQGDCHPSPQMHRICSDSKCLMHEPCFHGPRHEACPLYRSDACLQSAILPCARHSFSDRPFFRYLLPTRRFQILFNPPQRSFQLRRSFSLWPLVLLSCSVLRAGLLPSRPPVADPPHSF